ncbi:RNA-directed DNA polymerase [Fodinibius salsisoli]|uniref:RNA-directed DNA polymerase n=1 Tax=Fodinibius salsisoli TaxID=2820877 RepID=A0ABT3PI67_9BACT|nr:RNA-directed DNA polymerase [Fodinibius salsisoli]MCW9705611.1 RNA-directed DNA polymerase [Fodinibius salsisoli]
MAEINIEDILGTNFVYKRLLKYGLFSETIDDIFQSKSFGEWAIENGVNRYKKRSFSLVQYRLTRNNNAPRILSIPHPIAYYLLCDSIRINWDRIVNKIGEVEDYEDRSMIIPKPNNLNNRLFSMLSYNLRDDEKFLHLDKQSDAKYFVHADISKFYPSIYSHSVCWALVGHSKAKKHQDDNRRWFNKLDIAIRSMQRNETIGIPIGPDTSNIVSELVLSRVDKELNDYDYLRFVDDYKCYCSTKEEADSFLIDLSRSLEKYHLRLNTRKTVVGELPKALDPNWVRRLREYSNHFLSESKLTKKSINRISEFLDLAINLAENNPGESALKYAVKVLSSKKYSDEEVFSFTFLYLSRICFQHPYFIDVFNSFLSKNKDELGNSIKGLIENEINRISEEHIQYRRSDVALWSLYIAIKYELEIKNYESISEQLIEDRDCLPSLMSYLYAKKNDLDISKYLDMIPQIIDEKSEDDWWIYIYQTFIDQPNKPVFNQIDYKDFYMDLNGSDVTFLNETLAEL